MSAPVASSGRAIDPAPACVSCRQRKLRCSRDLPTCEQCIRLSKDCVYDHRRQKPGLKAGTIDSIHRRLDDLERKVSENERICMHGQNSVQQAPLQSSAGQPALEATIVDSPIQDDGTDASRDVASIASSTAPPAPKRRRLSPEPGINKLLSSDPFLDAAITQYFRTVHHWVPMVHEGRLREKLNDSKNFKTYDVLLHAMVASSLKHIDPAELGLTPEGARSESEAATTAAIMQSISQISMQSAQALIIITFEKLGQREWSTAWSLLGTLTRMIDCLGLTNDESHGSQQQLLRPLQLLDSPSDCAESEERRRVFWNVLLLDRFCSVSCGWPTVLTSDKVRRRLPCNGALWRNREPSTTPFFGVWDKAQAKLGHPVAYLPAHRFSSANDENSSPINADGSQRIDVSHLGAVAYRIEAMESLSQISSFFLQQPVDLRDPDEMRDWLTRFTELDLRLVHWKLFLPQQWRESNVIRTGKPHMDPNLTLAHVIHNTSTVLLHQQIAYPPPALKQAVKLPSPSSTKTCQLAAVEIVSITARYVKFIESSYMFVNSEFVFCGFVAGIALLAHSHYCGTELATHFHTLVECLDEMSARWNGYATYTSTNQSAYTTNNDLAALAAFRLRQFQGQRQDQTHSFADILLQSTVETLMYTGIHIDETSAEISMDETLGQEHFQSQTMLKERGLPHDSGQEIGRDFQMPSTTHVTSILAQGPDNPLPQTSLDVAQPSTLHPTTTLPLFTSQIPTGPYIGGPTYIPDYSILPNLVVRDDFADLDRVITSHGTNFDFESFLQHSRSSY